MGLIVLNARSDLAFEVAFNWESFGGIAQNELQFSDQILSGALMSVLLPLILSKSALFFFYRISWFLHLIPIQCSRQEPRQCSKGPRWHCSALVSIHVTHDHPHDFLWHIIIQSPPSVHPILVLAVASHFGLVSLAYKFFAQNRILYNFVFFNSTQYLFI